MSDVNSVLLSEICKGKIERVREILISYDLSYSKARSVGYVPLRTAVEYKKPEIVMLLLQMGCKVNKNPKDSINKRLDIDLLNLAVKKDCKEIVEILLQYGADVNAVDKHGRTALHFTEFDENSIRFYFDYNDSKDSDDKVEIVKLLLKHGANVDAKTNEGIMTLHAAVQRGYVKVVDALLEHNANVNSRITTGITLFHFAVQKGNKAIITKLLDKGADVDETLENKGTLLHVATQNKHKKIVKILLNYGAPVDSKVEINITPLYIAARQGDLDIVKILLDHGADVNSTDEDGATALHIASNRGHENIVNYLIHHGCDINIVTKKNYTPIDFARANSFNERKEFECEYYRTISHYHGPLSTCSEKTINILKMQIIRLKTANLYVNQRNLSLLSESMTEELRNFQKSCEKEIELMEYEKIIIHNDNISFSDVLTNSELVIHTKNDNIKQILQSDAYKLKFPIYERIMFFNFKGTNERKELLEESLDLFYSLFEISEILPFNCVLKTFSNL